MSFTINKNSLKILTLSVLTFGLLGTTFAITQNGLWEADNTPELSLAQQLNVAKTNLMTNYKDTFQTLQDEFTRVTTELTSNANYQSLVCLNIMSSKWPLPDMQTEYDHLNTQFLKKYVDINADIFNVLNQYSVWLIDTTIFAAEKQRLQLEISSFNDTYLTLLNNFKNKYLWEFLKFTSDIDLYTRQNTSLLQKIGQKVILTESIITQYGLFADGVLQMNSSLNIAEDNFFITLENSRDTITKLLNDNLQWYINHTTTKFSNVPNYKTELLKQKEIIMKQFQEALDNKINTIFGDRYDHQEYIYVKEQVQLIKEQLYDKNKLNCNKLLVTNIDLETYIPTLQNKISNMNDRMQKWLTILSQQNSNEIKDNILADFKAFYATKRQTDFDNFRIFSETKMSELLNTTPNSKSTPDATSNWDKKKPANPSYQFDKVFLPNQYYEWVKILQELLTQKWLYNDTIDGRFGPKTIQALYQFQLQKWILKWIAWEEDLIWYPWPATRAALNLEIQNIQTNTPTGTNQNNTTTSNEPQSNIIITPTNTNPFLGLIYKLETKQSSKETFKLAMQRWLTIISDKIENYQTDISQKIILQKIKEAIQLYLTGN